MLYADQMCCAVCAVQLLVTSSTKLVAVNFPHNPTGATLSAQDYEAMVQVVSSAGAWLFSDEMYKFLGGPGGCVGVCQGDICCFLCAEEWMDGGSAHCVSNRHPASLGCTSPERPAVCAVGFKPFHCRQQTRGCCNGRVLFGVTC